MYLVYMYESYILCEQAAYKLYSEFTAVYTQALCLSAMIHLLVHIRSRLPKQNSNTHQ